MQLIGYARCAGEHLGGELRCPREDELRGDAAEGDGELPLVVLGALDLEQALAERDALGAIAQLARRDGSLGGGQGPLGGVLGDVREGVQGIALRLRVVALPLAGFGLDQAQGRGLRVGGASAQPEHGAFDRGAEIVAAEGLEGGAPVVGHGALRLSASSVVGGEGQRLALAGLLEPRGGEAMTPTAIRVCEGCVGRVPDEAAPELELALPGEARAQSLIDDLLFDEEPEHGVEAAHEAIGPDQLLHSANPEALPEHARRPEHAASVAVELLEPRLRQQQDPIGDAVAALARLGAQQLLQPEGVALGPLDDAVGDDGLHLGAEDLAHEVRAGAPGQPAQAELGDAALAPQLGEQLVDLRASQDHDHERVLGQVAQRRVDELHRGQVAPVEVIQDEHRGVVRALGGEPILERPEDLISPQHRVLARGAQLRVHVVEGRADQLADELRDAAQLRGWDDLPQPLLELVAPSRQGLAVGDVARPLDGLDQDGERGPDAHRIAPAPQDLDGGVAPTQLACELVGEARLADAGGARHEHDVRDALVLALVEGGTEQAELSLAPYAAGLPPQHRTRRLEGLPRTPQQEPEVRGAHVEARVEQRGRGLVDPDRAAPSFAFFRDLRLEAQQRRARRLDGPPRGAISCVDGEPGREGDRRRVHGLLERDRATRRLRHLVSGAPATADDGEERPVCQAARAHSMDLRRPLRVTKRLVGAGAREDHTGDPLFRGRHRGARARRALGRDVAEVGQQPQPTRHLTPRGRSVLRRLGQHPPDELVELERDLPVERAGRGHLLCEDLGEDLEQRVAREGSLAREALEEHAAEGEDVCRGAYV